MRTISEKLFNLENIQEREFQIYSPSGALTDRDSNFEIDDNAFQVTGSKVTDAVRELNKQEDRKRINLIQSQEGGTASSSTLSLNLPKTEHSSEEILEVATLLLSQEIIKKSVKDNHELGDIRDEEGIENSLTSPGRLTLIHPDVEKDMKSEISSEGAIATTNEEITVPSQEGVNRLDIVGFGESQEEEAPHLSHKMHSYQNSIKLPFSIIPNNETPDACDTAVEAVLALLQPHEAQIAYRDSARAFLGRTVRRSLNAKTFESGLHALRLFLPDDPIRLSVLLWRGNSTNWLTNLTEKLKTLTEQPNIVSGGNSINRGGQGFIGNSTGHQPFDDENFTDVNSFDIDNEPKPTGDHFISNINPSSYNGHSRMLCTIDAVGVEIVPNGRSDLCFLALVEEIAQLVGKKELFKRSLLLIRGWWTYETSAYIASPTKNFLSDSVLSVLVGSIFNQYHATIHQPLQALCIFIAEYSDLKWDEMAVTLQGVVPFHTKGALENQPWLREPLPSELVTAAILQKHCDFYHKSSASNSSTKGKGTPEDTPVVIPQVPRVLGDGISPLESTPYGNMSPNGISMLNPGLPNSGQFYGSLSTPLTGSSNIRPYEYTAPSSVSVTPSGIDMVSAAATVAGAAALLAVKDVKKSVSDPHCYSPTAVRNFQKRVINIVHPLTNANMSTTMSIERVAMIGQVFDISAKDLHSVLKGCQSIVKDKDGVAVGLSVEDTEVLQAKFDKFFRGVLARFNGGWRPDIFESTLPECGTVTTTATDPEKPEESLDFISFQDSSSVVTTVGEEGTIEATPPLR
jgi:hypothetical protein